VPCYWDFITIWSERYVIPQCWRWWFLQQFYTEPSQPFKPVIFWNSSCRCPCLLKICWWDMQLQRNKKSMHNIIVHLDPCIVNSSKMNKSFNPLFSTLLVVVHNGTYITECWSIILFIWRTYYFYVSIAYVKFTSHT
jgi:hypothetical protein